MGSMRARHDYRRSLERVTDPDCAPGLRAGRDHLPDVVPEALATQARGGRGLRSPLIVHTISPAEITFDPAKDVTNTAKHGVSLALASELEWADLMAQADTRRDYGEDRMIGYTPIGERVFCVVSWRTYFKIVASEIIRPIRVCTDCCARFNAIIWAITRFST